MWWERKQQHLLRARDIFTCWFQCCHPSYVSGLLLIHFLSQVLQPSYWLGNFQYPSNKLFSCWRRPELILIISAVAQWLKVPFILPGWPPTGFCGHAGAGHYLGARLLFSPKTCCSPSFPCCVCLYFLLQSRRTFPCESMPWFSSGLV